ncbi:EexN family lipoprotein [Sphingomonas sanguinis]|uniref:EexN family lipoprotein n=1 Tax=Sphingomonas sp. LC-1 TaxID=3110957 RepID=UPI0021BB3C4B|nr:EexN family lipoprotein [Sphingomonas sp. LC-1]MCT8003912.1 EexN family lipoprotein [Sphingomonas sp. LC-1]
MKKLSIALVVAAVLAGCGENTPVQTADWYKAHDKERLEMLAKCKASPGELAASPNCVNARAAQNQLDLGSKNYGVDVKPPTFKK